MHFEDNRERRGVKRELKRKGNQRLRRIVKRRLAEAPEDYTEVDPVVDYGRLRSSDLNGFDHDRTRAKRTRMNRPSP